MPMAVVILNRETSLFSFINSSARNMLEVEEDEWNKFDFSTVFEDKVDLLDLLVAVEVNNLVMDVELCMYKSKTKNKMWVKANAQRGCFMGHDSTFITLNDFTADKSQELELKESRKKAETASFAKSTFLANMSHEIRTPMNSIIGFSEILSKRLREPRNLEYINSVVKSGRALLDLINDVLDYSKIEAGKFKLNNNSANLFRMVSDVYELFFYDAEIKGLKFNYTYPQNVPIFFTIDETRLKQVLINLISNAIKFTHKGAIKLNVELEEIDSTNYEATFIVSDTGIGIGKKQQENIFEAFAQHEMHDTKKYGGTGLGLTIACNLVKLMGGQLTLESTVGKGSTFRFTIPIARGNEVNNLPDIERIPKNLIRSTVFKHASILIINDDDELRSIIAEYLKDRHLKIYEVRDGEEGVKIAHSKMPDVILVDIQLLEVNGFEVLERIRNELKSSTIVAMVDSSTNYLLGDYNKVQFDSYIEKPLQEEDLLNVLAKFIPYQNRELGTASENVIGELKIDITSHKIIKDSCKELFDRYKEKKSNNNIRNLAECLINVGEENHISKVKELGVMLENAQQIYDIDKIDKVTDLLSSIIN